MSEIQNIEPAKSKCSIADAIEELAELRQAKRLEREELLRRAKLLAEESEKLSRAIEALRSTASIETAAPAQNDLLAKSRTLPDKAEAVLRTIKSGSGVTWNANQVSAKLHDLGISLGNKSIYNSLNYLERRGDIQRIRPGQYRLANGTVIETSDALTRDWSAEE